jgi:hypothetical protein
MRSRDETAVKIMTLHPQGKQGVRIDLQKYQTIKTVILDLLNADKSLPFAELNSRIKKQLSNHFDGSITWYVVTVKLDLEARGIIQRVENVKPQKLMLNPDFTGTK